MRILAAVTALVLILVGSPAYAAPSLETLPGTAWWTDPATGTRTVAADDTVNARDLRRLAASDATLIREPGVRAQRLMGGDTFYNGTSTRCTVGFNLRDTVNYLYYFVTAAHCVSWQGATVYNGATVLGVVAYMNLASDIALVRYTNVAIPHPSSVNLLNGTTQRISTFAQPFVGQSVQRVGTVSGLRSGFVTSVNVTVYFADGTVVRGLARTSVCADPGDSGGPFFSGTIGLGTLLAGTGNCATGGVSYFSPTVELTQAFGLVA